MSIERELFEILEPPPGGVERMRARFAEPRARVAGFKLAAYGVAALVAVVTLTALLVDLPSAPRSSVPADNPVAASPKLDRLLGRESRPMPLTVERDGKPVQAEELPSSDPRVRIYRVL